MRGPKSLFIATGFFLALYALSLFYNLNYFYIRGGAVEDAGWFSWLTSNAVSWPMPNPAIIGGNFLSIHASFIFFLTTSVLHPFKNLPEAVRFSLIFSFWIPLFWLSIFLMVRRFWLATLLTLNGLNLAMLGFPHIESFIAPLAFLSLAISFRNRGVIGFGFAIILLCLALLFREDAGLHIFILITALLTCQFFVNGILDQRLVTLSAIALGGSIISLLIQKFLIPSGGSQINLIYFGNPPFSTITVFGLLHRLLYWATRRSYIFLPLVILAIFAIRSSKNRLLIFGGIVIALPWLALSLVAVSPLAGNLMDYYCFPLLFTFFWPLFLAEIPNSPRLMKIQIAMGIVSTLTFIAFGTMPFVGDGGLHDRAPWKHLLPPRPSLITATQAALANKTDSIFDDGAASLIIGELRPGQFAFDDAFTPAQLSSAKTYIHFATPPAAYIAVRASELNVVFSDCRNIPSTRLVICQKTTNHSSPH